MNTDNPIGFMIGVLIIISLAVVTLQFVGSIHTDLITNSSNSDSDIILADNASTQTLSQTPISPSVTSWNRTWVEDKTTPNQMITLSLTGMQIIDTLTYSGWFNTNLTASDDNLMDIYVGFEVYLFNNTLIGCEVENNTGSKVTVNYTTNEINDSLWHHIGCTYDGAGNLTMYWEGVPVGSVVELLGDFGTQATNSYFGTYGYLDEVRYYNSNSLSRDEMLEIYNSGRITNSSLVNTGLLNWFSFNENSGLTAYDMNGGTDRTLSSDIIWNNDAITQTVPTTSYNQTGTDFTIAKSNFYHRW